MGIFDKKRIEFKKPFIEKYRLTVTSEIQTGNMLIKSKALIRWEVKVSSISENYIRLEVITLDNDLIEYNNPLVKSVADMNRTLAAMWSELELTLDDEYKLVKINNLSLLKEKWERIKIELKNILNNEPAIISNVINMNDKNFENPNVIANLIKNNEFFQIYFHQLFGSTYNATSELVKRKNIFNTAILDWKYDIREGNANNNSTLLFFIDGNLETHLNKNWVKESYKSFTHLDLDKIQPVMKEKGKYRIDLETGKILKAYLEKEEIAHPQILHGKISYYLQSEESIENENKPKPQEIDWTKPPKWYNPAHSLIVDD